MEGELVSVSQAWTLGKTWIRERTMNKVKPEDVALVSFYKKQDANNGWWFRVIIENHSDRAYGPFATEALLDAAMEETKKTLKFESMIGLNRGGSA